MTRSNLTSVDTHVPRGTHLLYFVAAVRVRIVVEFHLAALTTEAVRLTRVLLLPLTPGVRLLRHTRLRGASIATLLLEVKGRICT